MKNNPYDSDPVIEVFSGTQWEADIVVTLLGDWGIDCFLRNAVLNTYLYDPIRASGVQVMVLESGFAEAKKVVDEYRKNRDTPNQS